MNKELLIHPQTLIKDALEKLGNPSSEILLVVDESDKLLGCLSNGDLRQYILSGGKIDGDISTAFNPKPIFIFENDYSLEVAQQLFINNKDINLLPIVDSKFLLKDSITWREIFTEGKVNKIKKNICTQLVIMAGGLGSRLEPLTQVLPKALAPINGKPIINHIIDKFLPYGVNDIFITVNHMAKIIKAYFNEQENENNINFVDEKIPLGTVGGVKLIKDKLKNNFFLSTCDVIVDIDLAKLYQFHTVNNYELTMVASIKDYNIPYGVCSLKTGGSLKEIIEKPKYNFLVNTGLYIINSSTLDYIPNGKLFHVTDLIKELLNRNIEVGVYPISEHYWIDIGQWAEYKKSMEFMNHK